MTTRTYDWKTLVDRLDQGPDHEEVIGEHIAYEFSTRTFKELDSKKGLYTNLISNPTFEETSPGDVTGWGETGLTVTVDSPMVNMVECVGAPQGFFWQSVAVTAGESYQFDIETFPFSGDSPAVNGTVTITGILDVLGLVTLYTIPVERVGAWNRLSLAVDVPSSLVSGFIGIFVNVWGQCCVTRPSLILT